MTEWYGRVAARNQALPLDQSFPRKVRTTYAVA